MPQKSGQVGMHLATNLCSRPNGTYRYLPFSLSHRLTGRLGAFHRPSLGHRCEVVHRSKGQSRGESPPSPSVAVPSNNESVSDEKWPILAVD